MKRPEEIVLLFEGDTPAGELLDRVAKRYVLEETGTLSGHKYFYDTFDWRLFRKEFVVTRAARHLDLCDFNGRVVASAGAGRCKYYFWWDIETSPLRDHLKKLIDMRALMRIFRLDFTERRFRVLNKDRKTVARIVLKNETARSGTTERELVPRYHLQEIRGYQTVFENIRKMCEKAGMTAMTGSQDPLSLAYSVSDRPVLDYGAKFSIGLDSRVSIAEAVAKICLDLRDTMQINHAGVCADIDSEFLHDFRIAIRRTRSLLTLLKKVLPPEQTIFFQSEFGWLGSVTGPVRDIDVYLLKRDEYLSLLPASLHDGLQLFFDELASRRVKEISLLRRHLNSRRYHELLEKWHDYLSDQDSVLFDAVRQKKCRPLADKLIAKRFTGFLNDGDTINRASPDEKLHKLRIKGKKLRYLLEFFRSFYEDTDMVRFLKQMKKLQDNLGDFNDLSVQQEMLDRRLSELNTKSKDAMQLGTSLGGLISVLARQHRDVRSAFKKTYKEFSKGDNRDMLNQMISGSGRRVS